MVIHCITGLTPGQVPALEEGETVKHTAKAMKLYLEDVCEGTGTLFVTEKYVLCTECKKNSNEPVAGMRLQLVGDEDVSELRYVPEKETDLDQLYSVFSECEALHPPEDIGNEWEDDDFYYDRDEVEAGLARTAAAGENGSMPESSLEGKLNGARAEDYKNDEDSDGGGSGGGGGGGSASDAKMD